jgi:hypothetical protein
LTTKKRKPWTAVQIRIVRQASREKRGTRWARHQMHGARTEGVIRQKAFSMGLSLTARKAATRAKTAKKAHRRKPKPKPTSTAQPAKAAA